MATLHLLGTGAAVSDPHRTTTMLAVTDGSSSLLVDCGGDAIQRYRQADLDLDTLDALIITHEHADHVSGFPLLMEKLWLYGRRHPLPVYGIAPALEQARRCFETFDTSGWDDMPELQWNEVDHEEDVMVLQSDHWTVTATPADHSKPNIGLRFASAESGGEVAYSCDTGPSPDIMRLSREADILVHEANGEYAGHSSPEQAADIAREADAGRLLLVHLPPGLTEQDLASARERFGDVEIGEELGQYRF